MQGKDIPPPHPAHLFQYFHGAAYLVRARQENEHIAAIGMFYQLSDGGGALLPYRGWLHIAVFIAYGYRWHVADFYRV